MQSGIRPEFTSSVRCAVWPHQLLPASRFVSRGISEKSRCSSKTGSLGDGGSRVSLRDLQSGAHVDADAHLCCRHRTMSAAQTRIWLFAALVMSELALSADLPTTLPADPTHGMVLFLKRCSACHGRHAWGDGPREIPALAGQHENYLTDQLRQFADGRRPDSQTHGPAMEETLRQPDVNRVQALNDLTSFLTQAARNPQPEYGETEALTQGKRSYERACISCHGPDGGGSERQRIPAIGGQHYSYLASRLRAIAAGLSAHPASLDFMPVKEQLALADYVSRLDYLRGGR